jgi:hypothetical protein
MKTEYSNESGFMKKGFIISYILIIAIIAGCGNGKGNKSSASRSDSGGTGKSEIVFREYQYDFGKVAEGEKISHTFIFDNKGTSDLVITSASTTCGCTVSKYNTKPIPPGETGNLEVVFDTSGRDGMQTKTITVKSNASKPVVLLKITAEVVADNK